MFAPGWLLLYLLAAAETPAAAPSRQIEFRRDVQPILEKRCTPCHFPGGRMHEELPFDEAATIRKLNARLVSRIKDDDERKTIREFLARD